ncbi:MAG: hypothetical protein HFI67_11700 [Lachnospiraceae bacterium]|jgi:hypothetical protein|nr:hypothetical protein [Lachnospiraceae bacterium]
MNAIKERIIGAVSLMTDKEAEIFWKLIQNRYTITAKSWNDIEEAEPDDVDLLMLAQIESDPECHQFVSEKEALRELGII